MKKTTFLCCIIMLVSVNVFSQILKPVTWSYKAKKTSATEATLYIKATLDKGWHLYSQHIKDGGPVKTTITFSKSKVYTVIGKTMEPKAITKFESAFEMNVSYFEKAVIFQQKFKLKGNKLVVKGKIEFMVCDDNQCLPPDELEFSVPIT